MSFECPYCYTELRCEDTWGVGSWNNPSWKKGNIFTCPNHEGFDTLEDTQFYCSEYLGISLEEALKERGLDVWEDLCCDSCTHHVSGAFYSEDFSGELKGGYPC